MCFSATADVVVGVAVGALGIDALRHVRQRRELPIALLPVLLGAHQLVEAVVWGQAEAGVGYSRGGVAAWVYLVVAFGVFPVLVPVAVTMVEPMWRRRRLAGFPGLGAVVAGTLLYATVRGPIFVSDEGHHLDYRVGLWRGGVLVALYMVVTCVPSLLSAYRHIQWFGAANLTAAVGLVWLEQAGLISLWCLWAAVSSIAICAHLRFGPRPALRQSMS